MAHIIYLAEVYRQPSNGLNINRRPTKMKATVKKCQRISDITISADLHGIPAPK